MNIKFKNLKDEKPAHRSQIYFINISKFYGYWEFISAEVDYVWDDENGGQICYHGESEMEDFNLYIGFISERGHVYEKFNSETEVLWAYFDDIEKEICDTLKIRG